MSADGLISRLSSALRWLLAPWWAIQIFTAEKSFHPNPILGSPTLNRRGFFIWRARVAHRLTHWRRRRLEHLISSPDRHAFQRDGYVIKRNFLSRELFAALAREVDSFDAKAGEFKEGDAITRRIPLSPENLRRLPACAELILHPQFRGLTRYVSSFDTEPLIFIQTIFTKVDEGLPDPQTSLHIDTFHPTMKAWLFLQDVAEEDGPLAYVPSSHLRTPRREAWERRQSRRASDRKTGKKGGAFRITKAELARLTHRKPKRFAVPGNTLVVADTYGFHARRPSQRPSARIEIWAYSRRNPFVPWTRFHPGSLPLFRGHTAFIGWWLMQFKSRLGLPAPQFREVVGVTPGAEPEPWGPAGR